MTVDFHTHIFPERIAKRTVSALAESSGISPHSDGDEAGLLSAMRAGGVSLAVNLPVLTRAEQFDSILAFASKINEKSYTGERIISFAGIHPDIPDPERAIERIKECGFLGIKIHPDYQNTFIDDDRYYRLLSLAKKHDLITVTHAGLDGAYIGQPIKCTPDRVMRLLDRLGGYSKLVLAHLGGNEMFSEVYDTLAGEDVYFDTAYILHVATREELLKIIERHGAKRILFATDSPWRSIKEEVELIRALPLSDEDRNDILSSNALRLLYGDCYVK